MIITQEAAMSARSGVATYSVKEEDRKVIWTITTRDLEKMECWDAVDEEERRRQVLAWMECRPAPNVPPYEGSATDPAPKASHSSWLELHGIVARNSLRRYLGLPAR